MTKLNCPVCYRDIAPLPDGKRLRAHKDNNDEVRDWCQGSGGIGLAPGDNQAPFGGASSVFFGPTLEQRLADGTITQARYDEELALREQQLAQIKITAERTRQLTEWWLEQAEDEAGMVCVKAVEYGATDLRDLGLQVLEMAGRNPHGPRRPGDPQDMEAYATLVGITFYAQGKLARIVAAIKEGRWPSRDSWLDLGVYARMAQRVHTHGGWPAVGNG